MAQGTGELEGDGEARLEAIRAEMRRTRAGLTRKLDLLKSRFLPQPSLASGAKKAMPGEKSSSSPEKRTKRSSESRETSGKKTGAKQTATSGAGSSTTREKGTSDKKTGAKQTATSGAGSSTTRKKTTRKKVVGAIADKTTEVLGEMLTGAAIGAVTGAAERVSDQPTAVQEDESKRVSAAKSEKVAGTKASPRKRRTDKPSGEVLGEMLSGAAVGAVTGAAKAVIPAGDQKGKGRAKSK